MRYTGRFLGFNYDIEKANDSEFTDWLMKKLKAQMSTEMWVQIVTTLLQQSDEYKQAKTKLQDHEVRITKLEEKVKEKA